MFILIMSLMIVSCGPGQFLGPTYTPTAVPTATSTRTPLPTATPAPTITPIPATFSNITSIPPFRKIKITGKLCLPDTLKSNYRGEFEEYWLALISPEESCSIVEGADSWQHQDNVVILEISIGDGARQAREIHDNYDYSDLKVLTDNGEVIGHESIITMIAIYNEGHIYSHNILSMIAAP